MPHRTGNSNAFATLLESGYRVGVGDALERRVDERLDALHAVFVDAIGKELHVIAALVQQRGQDVFEKRLREVGVRGEIRERDLGFDHPELGEVAAGVAVLRAERRPECVDLRERETVGLDVELTADGQERFLPEEVFR